MSHECPDCLQVCYCDGEDAETYDPNYECAHPCEVDETWCSVCNECHEGGCEYDDGEEPGA